MKTLEDLDIFCTIKQMDASISSQVCSHLERMGLNNLAELFAYLLEEREHAETIIDHFGMSDLEDVADKCDSYMLVNLEDGDYIHCDDISEHVDEHIGYRTENFVSALESSFDYFIENEVRQKLGYAILSTDDVITLKSLFHDEMSNAGLE